jgi:uncharacterized membrane protein YkvA (DUF1232 family)
MRKAHVANDKLHPSLLHRVRIELHAAWLAARDHRTPWYARVFGLLLTAYALSPLDLVPDFIPVIGLVDDAIVIPVGLWLFAKMLPVGLLDQCRAIAERESERPRSTWGVIIVILLWLAAAGLIYLLLAFSFN